MAMNHLYVNLEALQQYISYHFGRGILAYIGKSQLLYPLNFSLEQFLNAFIKLGKVVII